MLFFLALFYLYLPAFVANASPVILAVLPGLRHLSRPLNRKEFGAHKTVRGFFVSPLIAGFVACFQYFVQDLPDISSIIILHFGLLDALLSGMLLGTGAMVGDVVKSYMKRRLGIRPGKAWPVVDGIDYMVGALVFFWPVYWPSPLGILFLLAIGPLLSLIANIGSYLVGWKKVWY